MKKTNLRKLFAVLMSAVLLLGLLAGCNSSGAGSTESTSGTEDTSVATPIASGLLVVNANGAVNVSYDKDGLVLELEGIDENGIELVGEYENYLGESCSDVVCTLIKSSSAAGYLAESNYVVIKQAVGSQLPGTNFMDELTTDAQAALDTVNSSAALMVITEEDLDDDGYINLETAKALTLAHLKLENFDLFDGSAAPVDGVYGFNVTAGTLDVDLLVDAVTGAVWEGVLDTGDDDLLDDDVDEVGTEPVVGEDVSENSTTAPSEDTTPTESNSDDSGSEEDSADSEA